MKTVFSFRTALVCLVLLPGLALAQDKTETAIRGRLNQFITATANKDWSAVLDLTYPGLFKLAPREQMLELFNQMENSGMVIRFEDMQIKSISPVFPLDNQQFAKVGYSADMTINFTGDLYGDDVMPFLKTSFETTFGADHVQYDKDNKAFRIAADKWLFAIAEKDTDNWFFIENNPEQDVLLEQIIPGEVRTHFSKQ